MERTIAAEALIVQRHQAPVDQEVRLVPSLVLDWVRRRGVEPLLVVCRLVACKAVYIQVSDGLICKLAWHVMLIHVRICTMERQSACSHPLDKTLQTAGQIAS
jgi:hypothetical protein